MIALPKVKPKNTVAKMKLSEVKAAYNSLGETYNDLVNQKIVYCPRCGNFYPQTGFYKSDEYPNKTYPCCKKCLLEIAEPLGYDKLSLERKKECYQKVLEMMNRPYIDELFMSLNKNKEKEKDNSSIFPRYITMVNSLPRYTSLRYGDSQFGVDNDFANTTTQSAQQKLKNAVKRFGPGFADNDYLYLESEYQDWITRYECETKTQEEIFERLCVKKWELMKATRSGGKTNELDKAYTDLMSSANLLPKQAKNAASESGDTYSFGQRVDEWEKNAPIPVDESFKDVDGIGHYIRVWFSGCLANCFGLKNAFTKEFEEEIDRYTVRRPESTDDGTSAEIYDKIFGKED